ncbi:hypothetical protein RCL1_000827 [Eukaryota sp. TZLM3-RCL]
MMSLSPFASRTLEHEYKASGILFVDLLPNSNISQVLFALQPKNKTESQLRVQILGGRRKDAEDSSSMDTCCRKLTEETRNLIPSSLVDDLHLLYSQGLMRTQYIPEAKYALYLVSLEHFTEDQQELLRSLPRKFADSFDQVDDGGVSSLIWITIDDLNASKKSIQVDAGAETYKLAHFTTIMLRRKALNKFISEVCNEYMY